MRLSHRHLGGYLIESLFDRLQCPRGAYLGAFEILTLHAIAEHTRLASGLQMGGAPSLLAEFIAQSYESMIGASVNAAHAADTLL